VSRRPFIYINMAMTVDGKITSATGETPQFSSPHDTRTMDRLRAEADAVLAGAASLRGDDPPLHVRHPEMQAYRQQLGKPAELIHVAVSRTLDLPPSLRMFQQGNPSACIVATVEEAPEAAEQRLAQVAEIWRIGRGDVDIGTLCERLAQRGVERLLVEGGAELNWAFIERDLVDEIYITISPALLGGRDAATAIGGSGFAMADQRRLRLLSVERQGDELYCRYAVTPRS